VKEWKNNYKMKEVNMKFKILCISLIIVVVSLPSICLSEQPDSKVWESFSNNYYYNKTNIAKSSDIISVWTYTIESDDNKRKMVNIWKNIDLEKSAKYQHYDHTIFLDEFDCKKKLKRRKEYIWYDDKRNVLDHHKVDNSEWTRVIPNSMFETLYDKLCVTPKKSSRKK
jgi:hypothetical protein